MLNRLSTLILLAVLTLAAPAAAHAYSLGDLVIDHPWARASAGDAKAGAVFLTVTNNGTEPDRLIGAASPVGHPQLHNHVSENGVMKMRPIEAVDLAPGETVVLQPGGLHIMLMSLVAPLIEGQSFPMLLIFEKAGSVDVTVQIEGVASMHEEHTPAATTN